MYVNVGHGEPPANINVLLLLFEFLNSLTVVLTPARGRGAMFTTRVSEKHFRFHSYRARPGKCPAAVPQLFPA